jgi:hypothetical protein
VFIWAEAPAFYNAEAMVSFCEGKQTLQAAHGVSAVSQTDSSMAFLSTPSFTVYRAFHHFLLS